MQGSRAEQEQVVERFLDAIQTGDLKALLDVLAPDVILISDGGRVAPAARRPIEGAERVARFLSRFPAAAPGARLGTVLLNCARAIRIDLPHADKVVSASRSRAVASPASTA
jgi:RNA polymerase sigma-70 factor (ECF subfamily)